MSSVNKVILVGNLGKDPEIRSMQSGSRIANFSVATSERWKDKHTGEKQEKTEWHRVSVFNDRIVDFMDKYIRKGRKLYVEGKLQTRKWTDQAGVERYATEIVVGAFDGDVRALDAGPRDGDDAGGGYGGGARTPAAGRRDDRKSPGTGGGWEPSSKDLDDEIPF